MRWLLWATLGLFNPACGGVNEHVELRLQAESGAGTLDITACSSRRTLMVEAMGLISDLQMDMGAGCDAYDFSCIVDKVLAEALRLREGLALPAETGAQCKAEALSETVAGPPESATVTPLVVQRVHKTGSMGLKRTCEFFGLWHNYTTVDLYSRRRHALSGPDAAWAELTRAVLLEAAAALGEARLLLTQHTHFIDPSILGPKAAIVTIVRHPLKRRESMHNYARREANCDRAGGLNPRAGWEVSLLHTLEWRLTTCCAASFLTPFVLPFLSAFASRSSNARVPRRRQWRTLRGVRTVVTSAALPWSRWCGIYAVVRPAVRTPRALTTSLSQICEESTYL